MTRPLEDVALHRLDRQKIAAPKPTYHAVYLDSLGERHEWQHGTATLEESRWRIEHNAAGGGWENWEKTVPSIREKFRPVDATIERIVWKVIGDQIVPVFEPRMVWIWNRSKGWLTQAEVQNEIDGEDVPGGHPGWIAGNWSE